LSFCAFSLGPESKAWLEDRVACVQSLSGTGAICLAIELLFRNHPCKTVYIPKPSWDNHQGILMKAGYTDVREYEYYDSAKKQINMLGLLKDLDGAPEQSIVLLQVCGQNPCGVDPSNDDWKAIADVAVKRKLMCVFDMAYQGFASGDPDTDAWSLRHFVERGLELFFCQSFAKIFGLYNERVGNLGVICNDSAIARNIKSNLKVLIRSMYLTPPQHGARVVSRILENESLETEW